MADTFILLFVLAIVANLGFGFAATVAEELVSIGRCSTTDTFSDPTHPELSDCVISLGVGRIPYPAGLTSTSNDASENPIINQFTNTVNGSVDETSTPFNLSWLFEIGAIAGFGTQLILNAFTGSFFFDVMPTVLFGTAIPMDFIIGLKVLYFLSLIGFFAFLILGKAGII